MSVKPLATTKYSAAAVRPLSSVIRKSLGSLTAEPNVDPLAMNRTQMTGMATASPSSTRAYGLAGRVAATSFIGGRERNRPDSGHASGYRESALLEVNR